MDMRPCGSTAPLLSDAIGFWQMIILVTIIATIPIVNILDCVERNKRMATPYYQCLLACTQRGRY